MEIACPVALPGDPSLLHGYKQERTKATSWDGGNQPGGRCVDTHSLIRWVW